MLRQYHAPARGGAGVGAAGVSSAAPGAGGWALKDSRDVFPTGHARPMSSRILAVGVMLAGALVLSVALIMGLEFPKYVSSQLKEDQCVVHDQHPKYQSWRKGTQWTREVYLYYHHLRNKEQFLYHGAKPLFQQKGPYAFTEYETRVDVRFRTSEVTYRVSRRHEFNAATTARECPFCSENDSLTVLNTEYLRRMYQTGGHANFLLSVLPSTLQDVLQLHGMIDVGGTPAPQAFQPNISLLGCLDPICDNAGSSTATSSSSSASASSSSSSASNSNSNDASEDVRVISFGKWLRTEAANSSYSSVILSSRTSASFSASETGAVYRVLLNSSLLGSGVFSSSSFSSGPTASQQHVSCLTWAQGVCQNVTPGGSGATPDLDVSSCGLVHVLQACDSTSVTQHSNARGVLSSFFCDGLAVGYCLDLNSTSSQVLSAYFQAFRDFTLQYLLQVIHDHVLAQRNQDVVVTRPQRELALGYYVTGETDQSDVHVQGLLTEDWLQTSTRTGLLWKVETCLKDRDINNNMKVREFNGSQYAPPALLRDGSSRVPFSGVTDFFTSCNPTTCASCSSLGGNLHLFQPALQRSVRFVRGYVTSLWDTDVYRYWLNRDDFSWNEKYDVSCGLQNVTSSLGFMGWMGIPNLKSDLLEKVGLGLRNCSLPDPQSFMDVEPITGRVWQRSVQMQMYAGIQPSDVSGPRRQPLNVTYLNKAVPVVWWERRATLSRDELDLFDYKVDRLMKVSCGGLIGLTVVAIITAAIGIVILVHPKKINRVVPSMDQDSSASNLNSRHINTT